MKVLHFIINLSFIILAANLCAQTNRVERLVIPGLDPESQSNVVVTVCDIFGEGQYCPPKYTNLLSNTNLFTLEQQKTIREAFVKYKNVTINSGPPGTVLGSLYKTNFVIKAMYRTGAVENWVARYQYTNSDDYDEVTIGKSLSARFRTKSKDGYNLYFNRTGDGTLLDFIEVKHDLTCGLLARFMDMHAQGFAWDYRLADFSNSRLAEYRQYTNGMVLGKYLLWNVLNGNLLIEAEFKEPYDWRKHYRQIQWP
jgi:hypothetical protein